MNDGPREERPAQARALLVWNGRVTRVEELQAARRRAAAVLGEARRSRRSSTGDERAPPAQRDDG